MFYDETRDRFDFHPILRSFLYRQLTSSGGMGVHDLAAQYFRALPEPGKVVSLEDLAPVIELYHHMVKAGKFDEAYNLFNDRIVYPTYYQLAAYQLQIELLKELFPGGYSGESDGKLPLLKKEAQQASALNDLANVYALSGQPANAVPLYLLHNKLKEKNDDKTNLAIGLGNAAYMAQIQIGQLSAAAGHLRKSIALCHEINYDYGEAVVRNELGRVLVFQGSANAEEELAIAFKLFEKDNDNHYLGIVSAYRSLSALLQARLAAALRMPMGKENGSPKLNREALHQARRALTFAEEDAKTDCPTPRDFVRAYWLLGEALIGCSVDGSSGAKHSEPLKFDIPFYDEYFQQIKETAAAAGGNELNAAQQCLHDALRRCRTANMVYHEPDILLALARLEVAQNKPPDETLLKEAKEIALRSGYRLVLTDIHLFCGQVLPQSKTANTLLGLTAAEHLQKTKEYALDVSDISHLYTSVKSPADDFYKDIPEYHMLKRGLTDEERIRNGYWVAYQIAETLLKI